MTSLLAKYLSVFLLQRFVLLSAGIMLLATSIDFLNRGEDILIDAKGNWFNVFKYLLYNLPGIFSNLIAIAGLVATLFVFITFMRNSELIAMLASGISQSQLMSALLPAAFVIAIIHLSVDNYLLPSSIHSLRGLGMMEYKPVTVEQKSEIWTREGNDIVRLRQIKLQAEIIGNVMIFKRDEEGHLTERLSAHDGKIKQGSLRLRNATRAVPNAGALGYIDQINYDIDLNWDTISALMAEPRDVSWLEIRELLKRPTLGNRPHFIYRIWSQKKLSGPLGTLTLIMLAIPLFQMFDRNANQFFVLMSGLSIGFLYVIIDSILVAIGEAALLTPFWAAWTPTFLLIALISALILNKETIRP